jgi:hypothetical protein
MASALARTANVQPTAELDLMLNIEVVYVGSDIPGGTTSAYVVCTFPGDAQPAQIRSAISNAIAVEAANLGFACAGANMSIPTFQKG